MTEQDKDREAASKASFDHAHYGDCKADTCLPALFLAGAQHGQKAERDRILGMLRSVDSVSSNVCDWLEEQLK